MKYFLSCIILVIALSLCDAGTKNPRQAFMTVKKLDQNIDSVQWKQLSAVVPDIDSMPNRSVEGLTLWSDAVVLGQVQSIELDSITGVNANGHAWCVYYHYAVVHINTTYKYRGTALPIMRVYNIEKDGDYRTNLVRRKDMLVGAGDTVFVFASKAGIPQEFKDQSPVAFNQFGIVPAHDSNTTMVESKILKVTNILSQQ